MSVLRSLSAFGSCDSSMDERNGMWAAMGTTVGAAAPSRDRSLLIGLGEGESGLVANQSPNIPDQWELRTPLLYCETASSSSEYRLRHNIFDKSGDPFKLASALSRRYTQRADPHHHQHHLISHLAARALASGLTSGRAGQVCTLRRSKPPRQSISLSARIRPGAQGLDGRDRVRGGRTTSSTLSYV